MQFININFSALVAILNIEILFFC